MLDPEVLHDIRNAALGRLAHVVVDDLIAPTDTRLDLVGFLRAAAVEPTLDVAGLATLDRLARKIEIAGQLYRLYGDPRLTPIKEAGLAPIPSVEALLATFLLAFFQTGDFRHINTVLKALGGSLRKPEPIVDRRLVWWCEGALWSAPTHVLSRSCVTSI